MRQVTSGAIASAAKQATGSAETDIYGVSWAKVASPVLTRTDDAVGMTAAAGVGSTPASNDFDSAQIYKDFARVYDSYGNEYIRIPKFWIEKKSITGFASWRVSKSQFGDAYLPKCFVNPSGGTYDYVDVGAYNASLSGDTTKLESKPNTYPLVNKNIVQMRDLAKANGSGYYQLDIHALDMLQTLWWVEFANLDSQSICRGFVDGRYTSTDLATVTETGVNRIIVANATAAYYEAGQTISIGTSQGGNQVFYGRVITAIDVYDASNKAISFDGSPVNIATGNYLYNTGQRSGFSANIAASTGRPTGTNGKQGMVYRGIENLWGSVWQFVDGVNINDYQAWVCNDPASYASNVFAAPYEQLSYINHNADGYFTALGHDPTHPGVSLPVAVGGGIATYFGDYYYRNSGQRIAFCGGYWYRGSNAGLAGWYLYVSSSTTHFTVGGRLIKPGV